MTREDWLHIKAYIDAKADEAVAFSISSREIHYTNQVHKAERALERHLNSCETNNDRA